MSFVKVDSLIIDNTEIAFAAFQKKPEFGPASIKLNKVKMGDNIKKISLIERKSQIDLDGDVLRPNSANVKDLLYNQY